MTLWTPGGEHPVGREPPTEPARPAPAGPGPQAPGPAAGRVAEGPADDPLAGLSPEERARAEAMVDEMAEVRQQLASVPAATVVANHAMGLYELAAIHLSGQPPQLDEARLAIDAMGAVVEGLAGRLGEAERTLTDALSQLRMAFVQVKRRAEPGGGGAAAGDPG